MKKITRVDRKNEVALDHADVVAIGDSQTWGANADSFQTWPQTLARLSDHSTYNMGIGGYGSVQYWVLTDEAVRFSPKVIVVGLYLGNDIWEAYDMVYLHDAHSRFRSSDADPDLLNDTIRPQAEILVSNRAEHKTMCTTISVRFLLF